MKKFRLYLPMFALLAFVALTAAQCPPQPAAPGDLATWKAQNNPRIINEAILDAGQQYPRYDWNGADFNVVNRRTDGYNNEAVCIWAKEYGSRLGGSFTISLVKTDGWPDTELAKRTFPMDGAWHQACWTGLSEVGHHVHYVGINTINVGIYQLN